jgi:hypothetical protein
MRPSDRREEGSALLVAMLLLVLMGMIGLAALQTVTQDRQVAGYQNRARLALYASDATLASAWSLLRNGPLNCPSTQTLPTSTLGDSTVYPYGQPSYGPDPEVAVPIKCVGVGPPDPSLGIKLNMGGGAKFVSQFWEVHGLGQTADGSVARVEARLTCPGGAGAN